jgi:hypothetical protein
MESILAINHDDVIIGDPSTLKTFKDLIESLEDGKLEADATEILHNIVRDLNHALTIGVKAKGEISLTIKMVADRGIIETVSDIKVKTPPPTRIRSMLYVANGRFLATRHPGQLEMPLRSVTAAAPEMRVVRD